MGRPWDRAIRFAAYCVKRHHTLGAAVVITTADRVPSVLLVRQRVRGRGRWGMPGGFIEPRESPAAAAVREVREETGLELSTVELVDVYVQPWARHVEVLFRASAHVGGQGGAAPLSDASEATWFSCAEVERLELTREAEHVLKVFRAGGDGDG